MSGIILFLISTMAIMISFLFFLLGKKMKLELSQTTTFECGFSSYFFSRFSFSIHYFIVAMIFLFLDLELCFMMPYMNGSIYSQKMLYVLLSFVTMLILGLTVEWKEGKLDWVF